MAGCPSSHQSARIREEALKSGSRLCIIKLIKFPKGSIPVAKRLFLNKKTPVYITFTWNKDVE